MSLELNALRELERWILHGLTLLRARGNPHGGKSQYVISEIVWQGHWHC